MLKKRSHMWLGLVLALCLLPTTTYGAELRFSRHLGNNALLQRDTPVTIRGFAEKDAEIAVSFSGQTQKATADATGEWSVKLDPLPANSKGRVLTAQSGGANVSLSNVVVGDLFLIARQTSIDISLGRTAEGQALAGGTTANPNIRILQVETVPSTTPLADLAPTATRGWELLAPSSAKALSAPTYHLLQGMKPDQGVPLGVIELHMGPSFTLGWIDSSAIVANDDYYGKKTRITGYARWLTDSLERFRSQAGKEKPEKSREWVENDPSTHPLFPAACYNAVLHPMRETALKAVLIQLGNDYPYTAYEELRKQGGLFDRAKLAPAWWATYIHRKQAYRAAFEVIPRLPTLWRKYLGDPELPIAFIMPPSSKNSSYATHNHEIREVQRQTAQANPNVGLILPSNDHIPFSGQPADGRVLTRRSLAWIHATLYGQKETAPCGPLFDRKVVNYNKVQVFFKEGTAQGLKATPGALDVFEVAAIDAEWFPAKATIDGTTIRLSSDKVNQVAYVRYNYRKRPHQGLTNDQDLPAIPFRTGEHAWIDVPRNKETNLPKEYSTPASEWQSDGVAIVSGGGAAFGIGPGWMGPAGFKARPFGPNMRVIQVVPGSPADGKILVGDMVYMVDGQLLGSDVKEHLPRVGRAIARAETEAGEGRITFSVRRGDELLDVELTIEVLGTTSSTTPYDCPKSDRIVANSEAYIAARGGTVTGAAYGGWLHTDSLFLLAAGTPRYQGLVRRFVYKKMTDLDKVPMGINSRVTGGWGGAHGALFFGEYYHATGDKNVLPYMEKYAAGLAATQVREETFPGLAPNQVGSWRHNYPGGKHYGMMATIGLPAMIGWKLAMEAGVKVDAKAYARGRNFFTPGQAEMGINVYATTAGARKAPEVMDPDKMAKGMVSGHNGSRGLAAVYYRLTGDTRIAHLNSLYCVYAFNECHLGHGSNFFNGMWTPIGASVHGKKPFMGFMKKHSWFQDLNRMYDHGYMATARGLAQGPHLALVVPRQRMRILGAPVSPFAADAPEILAPALAAYYARDYGRAAKLAAELLGSPDMTSVIRGQTTRLLRAASELRESISLDLAKVGALLKEGMIYEASLDLPQLMGVMPEGDARLAGLIEAIGKADPAIMREGKSRYDALMKSLQLNTGEKAEVTEEMQGWQPLTTQISSSRHDRGIGILKGEEGTRWHGKVLEAVSDAPDGWFTPEFDASRWHTGTLPFSWHLNHALIARTTFNVTDKRTISALRATVRGFRQLNIVVYLNGKIVAKFNQCEGNKGWVHGDLTARALQYLKDGKNTLAFSTTNDWRWGTRSNPDNGGFGLILKAKVLLDKKDN